MPLYLGLDTSNYTTSAALYDSDANRIVQQKKLLPVKPGERGLRQSDAVFHHTVQLPDVIEALGIPEGIAGIGVSTRPRSAEGSYMPCFLVGEGTARMLGAALHVPVCRTSHQIGHILAALYSADKLELLAEPFLAFHVSGGTTDLVLCEPDAESGDFIRVKPLAGSLDLKAGQLIDRIGVRLGLQFPCGAALEQLAVQSNARFHIRPTMRGMDCCLSGVENQCVKMLGEGASPEDTAMFALLSVAGALTAMTDAALAEYGGLPVLYAGGVMSDTIIRERLEGERRYFAAPAFSCDNAAGTAIFASQRLSK